MEWNAQRGACQLQNCSCLLCVRSLPFSSPTYTHGLSIKHVLGQTNECDSWSTVRGVERLITPTRHEVGNWKTKTKNVNILFTRFPSLSLPPLFLPWQNQIIACANKPNSSGCNTKGAWNLGRGTCKVPVNWPLGSGLGFRLCHCHWRQVFFIKRPSKVSRSRKVEKWANKKGSNETLMSY